MKNRLLVFNFSLCEIIVNAVCLVGSFFFLSGYHLYTMIAINLFLITTSLYVLRWSFNNKVYDSDILMQCRKDFIVFSMTILVLGLSIKIAVFYVFLSGFGSLFETIDKITAFTENIWVILSITALIVAIVSIFFGAILLYYISSIKEKTSYTHLKERADFINNLRLNADETFFCMDKDKLSGFVSSGKLYAVNKGFICKDVVFEYHEIVSYLKETGLTFSELDSGHIEIMKMYSI